MIECDRFARAVRFRHGERRRAGKPGITTHERHGAAAGERGQPAGERGDDLVLAGPQGINVDRGPLEADAPFGHLPGFSQHPAHVQKRLGWNAAAKQAGASKPLVPLDDRHLHAEVGRQKRRGVAAGPTTEHHKGHVH